MKPHDSNNCKTLVSLLLAGSILTGCSTTDSQKTVEQGAGVGALLGAGAGAIFGDSSKAAIIGGAVGAAAGGLYGKSVSDKKAEYAMHESDIKKSIAQSEQTLELSTKTRSDLENSLDERTRKLAALRRKAEKTKQSSKALNDEQDSLKRDIEQSDKLIAKLSEEIENQNQKNSELTKTQPEGYIQLVSMSESSISKLTAERTALTTLKSRLSGLDSRRMY